MSGASQDELNALLFSEIERLTATFDRLKQRGVISETDEAIAALMVELRATERRVRVGDDTAAAEVAELREKILRLEESPTPPPRPCRANIVYPDDPRRRYRCQLDEQHDGPHLWDPR